MSEDKVKVIIKGTCKPKDIESVKQLLKELEKLGVTDIKIDTDTTKN